MFVTKEEVASHSASCLGFGKVGRITVSIQDHVARHFRRSVCGREDWRHPIEVRDGGLHVAVLMWPILDQVLVLRYS